MRVLVLASLLPAVSLLALLSVALARFDTGDVPIRRVGRQVQQASYNAPPEPLLSLEVDKKLIHGDLLPQGANAPNVGQPQPVSDAVEPPTSLLPPFPLTNSTATIGATGTGTGVGSFNTFQTGAQVATGGGLVATSAAASLHGFSTRSENLTHLPFTSTPNLPAFPMSNSTSETTPYPTTVSHSAFGDTTDSGIIIGPVPTSFFATPTVSTPEINITFFTPRPWSEPGRTEIITNTVVLLTTNLTLISSSGSEPAMTEIAATLPTAASDSDAFSSPVVPSPPDSSAKMLGEISTVAPTATSETETSQSVSTTTPFSPSTGVEAPSCTSVFATVPSAQESYLPESSFGMVDPQQQTGTEQISTPCPNQTVTVFTTVTVEAKFSATDVSTTTNPESFTTDLGSAGDLWSDLPITSITMGDGIGTSCFMSDCVAYTTGSVDFGPTGPDESMPSTTTWDGAGETSSPFFQEVSKDPLDVTTACSSSSPGSVEANLASESILVSTLWESTTAAEASVLTGAIDLEPMTTTTILFTQQPTVATTTPVGVSAPPASHEPTTFITVWQTVSSCTTTSTWTMDGAVGTAILAIPTTFSTSTTTC